MAEDIKITNNEKETIKVVGAYMNIKQISGNEHTLSVESIAVPSDMCESKTNSQQRQAIDPVIS